MTFDGDLNTWFPHISPDGEKVAAISYHKGDSEPWEHLPHKNVLLRLFDPDGRNIRTAVELFGGQGSLLFLLAAAVSYMLSGYYGLYSKQKILYSKTRPVFIDTQTK